MKRWKHLLPRFGILLFAALLVNLMSGSFLTHIILQTAQSISGSQVEIGTLKASMWRGHIRIDELQIADPRQPMHNLLQAKSVELQVNPGQLLRRRWIIDHARMDGIQFGTPRTNSGSLRRNGVASASRPTIGPLVSSQPMDGSPEKRWSDQVQARLPILIEADLDTTRVAKQIREQWAELFPPHREVAVELRQRSRRFQREFEKRTGNPLRDFERFQTTAADARQLLIDFEDARQAIVQLSTGFRSDLQTLLAAKQRDIVRINRVSRDMEVSSDELSSLLLARQKSLIEKKLSRWLQWFREAVPDGQRVCQNDQGRGFDLQFRRHPGFLIRHLDFEGEGTFLDTPTRFSGTLHNFSDAPQIAAEPITFEISSEGEHPVLITGLVDRRGPQKIDTLTISCPQITSPSHSMGFSDALAIDLEQGLRRLEVNVRLVDDELSGDVVVRHSRVAMNVTGVHPLAAGAHWIAELNRLAKEIDSFEMRIELSGTLQNPRSSLQSSLGDRFAKVLENAFRQKIQQVTDTQTARVHAVWDHQLSALNQMFTENTDELMEMLIQEVAVVAHLQSQLSPKNNATQRFR